MNSKSDNSWLDEMLEQAIPRVGEVEGMTEADRKDVIARLKGIALSHIEKNYIEKSKAEEAEKKAREVGLVLAMNTMKDYARKVWTYELLFGGIKDLDDRDVIKEYEEYVKLEPEREQFAQWYEKRVAELRTKLLGGNDD